MHSAVLLVPRPHAEFMRLGFEVFGVSSQDFAEQVEFSRRNKLPYQLLNDSDFQLTKALHLPTFKFQSKLFMKRLALAVREGRIDKLFYPVFPPNKNAELVLEFISVHRLKA